MPGGADLRDANRNRTNSTSFIIPVSNTGRCAKLMPNGNLIGYLDEIQSLTFAAEDWQQARPRLWAAATLGTGWRALGVLRLTMPSQR